MVADMGRMMLESQWSCFEEVIGRSWVRQLLLLHHLIMSLHVGVGGQVGRSLSPFYRKGNRGTKTQPLLLRAGRPVGVEVRLFVHRAL